MDTLKLFVDTGQLYLDDGHTEYVSPTDVIGFVEIRGCSVSVETGIAEGIVQVSVDIRSGEPDVSGADQGWEEWVELSIPRGSSEFFTLYGFGGLALDRRGPGLGRHQFAKPSGPYIRARVLASGRERNWDEVTQESAETYRVEMWSEQSWRQPQPSESGQTAGSARHIPRAAERERQAAMARARASKSGSPPTAARKRDSGGRVRD